MKFERKLYNYYWPKLALSNARLANYSKIPHVYRNSTVIKCYMQIMNNYIFKENWINEWCDVTGKRMKAANSKEAYEATTH